MSEPKLISPLLDQFIMGDPISDHGGVKACPAMKQDSDDKYIVKIISIPASPAQLDALLLSGAYTDKADALAYYKTIADGILEEASVLQTLSKLEGYFCYEALQVEPMEDGSGFDVYLLAPYRRSLSRHFTKQTLTHLGALNLGLDLCSALAVARRSGYLYAALKPENVYLTADQGYRIGDIGFLKLDSLKYASMPDRYRSAYTAPEIEDAYSSLNTTIDVYAAGLILYQAYNGGILPELSGELPPPDFADYEISDIILKACAADPKERWQDPVEMGQAIVSYMQRNGAHDVPIVPPVPVEPVQIPVEEPADSQDDTPAVTDESVCNETQTNALNEHDQSSECAPSNPDVSASKEETQVFTEDDFGNLTFLDELSGDETLPGGDSTDLDLDQISVEVSDMLTQADELISHPTPEPVIPPDPVEVTLPSLEEPSDEQPQEEAEPAEGESDAASEAVTAEGGEEDTNQEESTDQGETEAVDDSEEETATIKPKRRWIRNTIIVLLCLLLLGAGYLFYRYFYLQLVNSITLEGSEDILTVYVDSEIDDNLLTVICTDTYGNQIERPVVAGVANFTDLAPDSAYKVKLAIKGFHKLTGKTSTAYTTPVRTDIVQFSAVTGTEDGSVVVGFSIEGPDVDQWKLIYSTGGEEPTEVLFSGHMYTLTGLTIGAEYIFELLPATELYITGNNKTSFTAQKLVRAENLTVTSCLGGELEAKWTAPQGVQVSGWTVRCYNENGYDQTVVVDTESVVLEGITDSDGYTLEVTAAGMSVNERVIVAKNSVTITDLSAVQADDGSIKLSWKNGNAPSDASWKVAYTVDGSPVQEISVEGTNTLALLYPLPGSRYSFSLQTADKAVLGGDLQLNTKEAQSFQGYKVTANRIDLKMCKTPSKRNWDRHDLSKSDYTTTFKSGSKASFLMHISGQYGISSDTVTVQFAIRDKDNHVVSVAEQSQKWSSMWHKNYGEFDIPSIPSAAGSYTVSVYFNGALVGQQGFTVTA